MKVLACSFIHVDLHLDRKYVGRGGCGGCAAGGGWTQELLVSAELMGNTGLGSLQPRSSFSTS